MFICLFLLDLLAYILLNEVTIFSFDLDVVCVYFVIHINMIVPSGYWIILRHLLS